MRGFRVALRHPTPFGQLVAFGVTVLLVSQAGMNMAVVLGLLPTKGLALPFVSYGGSAMIAAHDVRRGAARAVAGVRVRSCDS